MKKFLSLLIFLLPSLLFAVIGQNGVSIAPDGTLLKWDEGAWDFFIMHKTALERSPENKAATLDENGKEVPGNPQGDTLVDQTVGTTYTLTSKHIPPDADVDRAFLIWLADADPDNLDQPTKNSVTLTFTNSADPTLTYSQEVKSEYQGNIAKDNKGVFQYEAVRVSVPVQLQKEPYCPGEKAGYTGVYTYRVEVSDFMKKIIAMGEERGMEPGEALYGDYNVKGIESSDHCYYMKQSAMVGGWALPFVYTSANIRAKKIYFYHGLEAYQHKAGEFVVNGFELPAEAIIRLGLVVFEGDPGLARTRVNGIAIPPEGLSISGHQNLQDYKLLANSCNPFKTQDSAGNAFNYTEIYNSISSIFGWQDDKETCIGDPDDPESAEKPIEYAIDADTFLVDSRFPPFDTMFNKGDMEFGLKIGSNQDQIFTNFLVVSVDTKAPQFDIPDGREKSYCSCAHEADAVCFDRPFYYTIKVQNWGENFAYNVQLQDNLPFQVEYVPGTTEIATKIDEKGYGTDWETVPDAGGKFPFEEPRKVAEQLKYCDPSTATCEESVWVRFVVRPKSGLSKNEVIKNSATILSEDGPVSYTYKTNSNIPLRLKQGTCPAITECELPPKAECGGVRVEGNDDYCTGDADCKDGKKCINNECVRDSSADLANGSTVSFGIGQNSPGKDDTSEIFVPNPGNQLVLGQFYLVSEGENNGKYYEFQTASFKFDKDSDVDVKNLKLYSDANGNGRVDEGDAEIAAADLLKNTFYAEFAITDKSERLFKTGIKHHFLVVADVSSTSGNDSKFSLNIEGPAAFKITDNGTVTVKGEKTAFATFRFEPSEGFVFTKGSFDPQIPSYKDFNGKHEMLQVRTKSIGMSNKISSIKIKTSGSFAKFGEGIKSVSLILDNDSNGVESSGDKVLGTIASFDSATEATFDKLDLSYDPDTEKYLIFKAEFKMSVGDKAKITVQNVKLDTGTAKGIPLSSKEFLYECDPADPNSCAKESGSDDGGCAVSALSGSDGDPLYAAAMLLAALFGILVFRFSRDGKKNR